MKAEIPPAQWSMTFFYNNNRPKVQITHPVGSAGLVELTGFSYDGAIEGTTHLTLDELYDILVKQRKPKT